MPTDNVPMGKTKERSALVSFDLARFWPSYTGKLTSAMGARASLSSLLEMCTKTMKITLETSEAHSARISKWLAAERRHNRIDLG